MPTRRVNASTQGERCGEGVARSELGRLQLVAERGRIVDLDLGVELGVDFFALSFARDVSALLAEITAALADLEAIGKEAARHKL